MPNTATLSNGKVLTIGDVLIIIKDGLGPPFNPVGKGFKIAALHNDGQLHVGIRCDHQVQGWHDLSGAVPQGHGYWIQEREIRDYFTVADIRYRIIGNVTHKGRDLKGLKCRIMRYISPDFAFVECDEHIGGGSGDGLGKKGHCTIVSTACLEEVKKEEKKFKKKNR